jgi:hypothetical protein
MTKHIIAMLPAGFSCSCGERGEGGERPTALASRHQLAALVQDAMNGSGPLVINCLLCNGESLLPATDDDTITAYASWLRSPCRLCGRKPSDIA